MDKPRAAKSTTPRRLDCAGPRDSCEGLRGRQGLGALELVSGRKSVQVYSVALDHPQRVPAPDVTPGPWPCPPLSPLVFFSLTTTYHRSSTRRSAALCPRPSPQIVPTWALLCRHLGALPAFSLGPSVIPGQAQDDLNACGGIPRNKRHSRLLSILYNYRHCRRVLANILSLLPSITQPKHSYTQSTLLHT